MTQVIMPKMGDGMEEGTLLEWLKKDGEAVKSGEIIGTIQTDKATLELEAPGSGILTGMLLKGGETVPVGKPIALILKDGETAPADWGGGSGATAAAPAPENEAPKAEATKSEPKQSEPVKEETPKASEPEVKVVSANDAEDGDGRVKASPLARKIAKEMGISLASVRGSGPGGRIVEKDVRGAQPAAVAAPVASSEEDTKVSLNRLRQITAQRTTQSKQQVPHFYVTVEVDVESIQSLRDQFEKQGAGKVTVNDFIIKACALALREMPIVNSTYQGDHLIQHGAVNIGMAVALDDGLTVPVIKNADILTIREIGGQARELAKKARENRLSLDALSDSTFSISNMGMLDVDVFAAIINTPNAGILAVGTAKKQVVVGANDSLEIRQRMNITGSFDHRVVDGAVGAKFVNLVKDYLQNPTRLLS